MNPLYEPNRPLVKFVPKRPISKCVTKIIFLFLNQNICCWYSKEPSQ